jgi:hypothetical protein
MADWLRTEYDRRRATLPAVRQGDRGPTPWVDSVLRGLRNDAEELRNLRARKSGKGGEYRRRVLRQTAGWKEPRPWTSERDPQGFRQALLAEYPKDGSGRIVTLAVRSVEEGLVVPIHRDQFVPASSVTPPVVPRLTYTSRSWALEHGAAP